MKYVVWTCIFILLGIIIYRVTIAVIELNRGGTKQMVNWPWNTNNHKDVKQSQDKPIKQKPKFEAGKCYIFKSEIKKLEAEKRSPFGASPSAQNLQVFAIKILDVKDGWVKWCFSAFPNDWKVTKIEDMAEYVEYPCPEK